MKLASSLVLLAAFVLSGFAMATTPAPHRSALPTLAKFEDFRRAAGTRTADTLKASFSIREVRWRPPGSGRPLLIDGGQPRPAS